MVAMEQADALHRILRAPEDSHRVVLNLSAHQMLTTAMVTKAYKHQSLLVHPDKNTAAGAEDAFKRLGAAHLALKEEVAKGQPRSAPHTHARPGAYAPSTPSYAARRSGGGGADAAAPSP